MYYRLRTTTIEGIVQDTFVDEKKERLFDKFFQAQKDGEVMPFYRAHIEECRTWDVTDKLKGEKQ